MYLCDFISGIPCLTCPFKYNSECGKYSSKQEIIEEMEDLKNNATLWLSKIKEEEENV